MTVRSESIDERMADLKLLTFPEGGAIDPTAHPAAATMEIHDAARAQVKCVPPRSKVAIVGFSPTSMLKAPFDDPAYEIWSINENPRYLPRLDRHFELHPPRVYRECVPGTDYPGWLRSCRRPIYMLDVDPEIPSSVRYPIEAATALLGFNPWDDASVTFDYFQCTNTYQIVLAILEGFTEIALYGIDLEGESEYRYQKPNAEFWLGFCAGRGIRFRLPKETSICSQLYRYGYDEPVAPPALLRKMAARKALILQHKAIIERRYHQLEAILAEQEFHLTQGELMQRGVTPHPTDGDWLPNFWQPPIITTKED